MIAYFAPEWCPEGSSSSLCLWELLGCGWWPCWWLVFGRWVVRGQTIWMAKHVHYLVFQGPASWLCIRPFFFLPGWEWWFKRWAVWPNDAEASDLAVLFTHPSITEQGGMAATIGPQLVDVVTKKQKHMHFMHWGTHPNSLFGSIMMTFSSVLSESSEWRFINSLRVVWMIVYHVFRSNNITRSPTKQSHFSPSRRHPPLAGWLTKTTFNSGVWNVALYHGTCHCALMACTLIVWVKWGCKNKKRNSRRRIWWHIFRSTDRWCT